MASQPFKPGNPTDPLPPTSPCATPPCAPTDPFPIPPTQPTPPPNPPQFPGKPTDPFPIPPPPAPVRPPDNPPPGPVRPPDNPPVLPTRQEQLAQQANQQSTALDASMRSILDTLGTTVGQSAAQSKAALSTVTNALRGQLKAGATAQNNAIGQVINDISQAVSTSAAMSQSTLDSIVNTLAAAPPSQYGSPVEVMPSEVAGRIAAGWKCSAGPDPKTGFYSCQPPVTTGTGTGTQPGPGSSAPPAPAPTLTPSPVAPTLQPAPAAPPKPNCNSCIITDDKGLWVESFNNLSAADAIALQNQVKMTPGYNITCFPMADQNCIPTLHPPFWSPPPKIVPTTGGGGGGTPVVPIVAPILVGGGGGGGTPTGQTPTGGGGTLTGQTPTGGGGGTLTGQTPTGGGGGTLTGQTPTGVAGGGTLTPASNPPSLTPTGGGGGTLTPTGSPIGSPSPTLPTLSPSPPSPPLPPSWCEQPNIIPSFNTAIPLIGGPDWCAAIQTILNALSQLGNLFQQLFPKYDVAGLLIPKDIDANIKTVLQTLPFGIGDLIIAAYQTGACVWDKLIAGIAIAVNASNAIYRAVTCSQPQIALGMVILKAVLKLLRRLRVGTDAGLWATIDIEVSWEQADAAVEYLSKYICPYIIPDSNTAMELMRGGWISTATYACWMKMQSNDPTLWNPVLEHGRPRPGLHERQAMLWRLRPNDNALGQSFTDAQFEASLRQDGFNEQWVGLLDAIKYNPYTLREIRQLLDSGVVGHDETLAAFKDMGFDPAHSETLTQMELVLTKRRREAEIVGLTPARISQLYARGKLNESDVSLYMQALSFSENQAERLRQTARYDNDAAQFNHFNEAAVSEATNALKDAYTTGTVEDSDAVTALVSLGAMQPTAVALVQVWAVTVKTKQAKTGMAALRKGWDAGYMSDTAALINLEHTGLTNANAVATLASWQLEREANERTLNVQQVLNQVATGQASAIEAGARLHNMGWYADDANVLIANAEAKLAASIAKAQQTAAKQAMAAENAANKADATTAAKKAKADMAAAKAAEQLAQHAAAAMRLGEAQLKRVTPVATLQKWLKIGYISSAAFLNRMVLMGYPLEIAQTMADQVCEGKGANCVDTDGPKDNVLTDSPSAGGAG